MHLPDGYKTKLKAGGIHFLLSLIILSGLLYVIFVHWYPQPFFSIEGGWNGMQLIVFVDLILGPLLTFIVFNKRKKRREIIFDLSLVVIVQLSALTWGTYQVYRERPVAVVFWEKSFYTVTADYFKVQQIKLSQLKKFDSHQPAIIYAADATDVSGLEKMQQLYHKHIPAYAQFHLYRDYHQYLPSLFASKIRPSRLNHRLQKKLKVYQSQLKQPVYGLLLTAKYQKGVMFMNAAGQVLDIEKL